MARPLRVEYPGAYYHIINRGNAGENIFIDEIYRKLWYSLKGFAQKGRTSPLCTVKYTSL